MTRLLLTLLAVLTGLMAQVSPAQARLGGVSRAEVAAQMPGASRIAVAASARAGRPANASVWRIAAVPALAPQQATSAYPPVMIGIDRARE